MSELVYLHAVTVLKTDPTYRTGNWDGALGVPQLMAPQSPAVPVLFITKCTFKENGGMSGLVFAQICMLTFISAICTNHCSVPLFKCITVFGR